MLPALLLLACGTPDCDDGYGFVDGECVPVDTDDYDGPINWGGGVSAELFYDRLLDRYCQELARCGATGNDTYVEMCMTFRPQTETEGYYANYYDDYYDDYGSYDYGAELRGCTVEPALVNACFAARWECVDYGYYDDSYVSVALPEVCNIALYSGCYDDYYDYTDYSTYYGYY